MKNMEETQVEEWKDVENTEEIVKWYGKYGRKASQIVKRFGKYSRKLWKYMKNMEEKYIFFYKTINTACNLFKFTLCPTVRRNNSVIGGHNSLCEE